MFAVHGAGMFTNLLVWECLLCAQSWNVCQFISMGMFAVHRAGMFATCVRSVLLYDFARAGNSLICSSLIAHLLISLK